MNYIYDNNFLYSQEADFLYTKLAQDILWRVVKDYTPKRGYNVASKMTWCEAITDRSPLRKLIAHIEQYHDCSFNMCTLSMHRDMQDYTSDHIDSKICPPENGSKIAVLSLGATRLFQLEGREIIDLNLSHGDLLVLEPKDKNWKDSIYKLSTPLPTDSTGLTYTLVYKKLPKETFSTSLEKYKQKYCGETL